MPANSPWFVYLLRCADGSLYAGITTDVARRLDEHNHGRAGAKYTRARRPVLLAWQQQASNRSEASRCEHQLRRLGKAQKEALVAGAGVLALPAPETAQTPEPAAKTAAGRRKPTPRR